MAWNPAAPFLNHSTQEGFLNLKNLALADDGTPVYTTARERKSIPVTAWEKASVVANETTFIAILIVTLDGIPSVTVTILAMACIC